MLETAREVGAEAASAQFDRLLSEFRKSQSRSPSFVQRLRTINQMIQECPAFSKHQLYSWSKNAANNGLLKCGALVRLEGRVYYHLELFSTWVRGRNLRRGFVRP